MRVLSLCAFVGALATGVAAIPASSNHGATGFSKRDANTSIYAPTGETAEFFAHCITNDRIVSTSRGMGDTL